MRCLHPCAAPVKSCQSFVQVTALAYNVLSSCQMMPARVVTDQGTLYRYPVGILPDVQLICAATPAREPCRRRWATCWASSLRERTPVSRGAACSVGLGG